MVEASFGELMIVIITVQRSQNRVSPSLMFKTCRLLSFAEVGLVRRRLLAISKQSLKRLDFSLIEEQLRCSPKFRCGACKTQLDDN
jgi:hypothetical protein